jgi:hypothetical protein
MAKKKLVTLVEAVQIVNEAFQNDPEKSGRSAISKQTIYNALHSGRLTKYGSRHFRQVDVEELLNNFGPKKSA